VPVSWEDGGGCAILVWGGECSRPPLAWRACRRAVSWEDALRRPRRSGWCHGGAVPGGLWVLIR